MKVKCQIVNSNILKNGMKLVIHLDDKAADNFLPHLSNFRKKPLIAEFNIDADKVKQIMSSINEAQRGKIYAILKDISVFTGNSEDAVKHDMKKFFLQNAKYDYFSLSNCSKELAKDFIEFLIGWCFAQGVPLSEHPKKLLDDIELAMFVCLRYKVCSICGKEGADEHHVDAIGMGRDRDNYDDSNHEKISLCRVHHSEAHNIGWETFAEKYHVMGIVLNN